MRKTEEKKKISITIFNNYYLYMLRTTTYSTAELDAEFPRNLDGEGEEYDGPSAPSTAESAAVFASAHDREFSTSPKVTPTVPVAPTNKNHSEYKTYKTSSQKRFSRTGRTESQQSNDTGKFSATSNDSNRNSNNSSHNSSRRSRGRTAQEISDLVEEISKRDDEIIRLREELGLLLQQALEEEAYQKEQNAQENEQKQLEEENSQNKNQKEQEHPKENENNAKTYLSFPLRSPVNTAENILQLQTEIAQKNLEIAELQKILEDEFNEESNYQRNTRTFQESSLSQSQDGEREDAVTTVDYLALQYESYLLKEEIKV